MDGAEGAVPIRLGCGHQHRVLLALADLADARLSRFHPDGAFGLHAGQLARGVSVEGTVAAGYGVCLPSSSDGRATARGLGDGGFGWLDGLSHRGVGPP